jgi:hypothetical protein
MKHMQNEDKKQTVGENISGITEEELERPA